MNRYKTLCSISAQALLLIALLLTGCSSDPHKSKQQYLESGIRYMHEGRHEHAILQFQNALKLDPHFVEAFYQLGQAHLAVHDWWSAYSALQQAVNLDPGRVDAALSLADLLLAAKEYDKAEAQIAPVLETGTNNPEAAYQLPAMSHPRPQPNQALQLFRKVVPQERSADMNPALAGTPGSKRQDLEADLRHLAVTNYPDETGKEHRAAQDSPSGHSAQQQAVNLDPGYVRVPLNRADLLLAANQYEKANYPKTDPGLTTSQVTLPTQAPQLFGNLVISTPKGPSTYMNGALAEITPPNPQNTATDLRHLAITNYPDKTLFQNPARATPNGTPIHATPEPGSVVLLFTGVLCLGFVIRRRRHGASFRTARFIPN